MPNGSLIQLIERVVHFKTSPYIQDG